MIKNKTGGKKTTTKKCRISRKNRQKNKNLKL